MLLFSMYLLLFDIHSFALAVMFLNQISGLEVQLGSARTELCRCRDEAAIDRYID
ncbi:MAG: hypothetical protein ABIZ64_09395 [Casimicrobium sp.]